MTQKIEDLPNLGPYMARVLAEIDIPNAETLRETGAVTAFQRLKFHFGREFTFNALWAMDAALSGIDCRSVSKDRKQKLKNQLGG